MRYSGLDLNLLAALSVILEARNISVAAERLNMSQPAASNAMKRLRDHFDDPLLVRAGRHMVLTDKARTLQPEIEDVLRRIDMRILQVQKLGPQDQKRSVTIGAADALVPEFLAGVSQRLVAVAPGMHLDIRPLGLNPVQDVDRGLVDLLMLPRQYASRDHPMITAYEEPLAVIVCAGGAWKSGPITAEQYLAATHVTIEIGPERKVPVDRAIIEQAHGKLTSDVSVASQVAAPWFVVGSDRIATIPIGLAKMFSRQLPLRCLPLPFDVPRNHIAVQWHHHREADTGLAWLRDLIVTEGAAYQESLL